MVAAPMPAPDGKSALTARARPRTLELAVESLAPGGDGLAHDQAGRVVFVAGGLPGESVRVRITEERAHYARAALVELPHPPSPERVLEPRCPHFGSWPERGLEPDRFCGGCQWQHIAYPAQLRYKAAIVTECLQRQGGMAAPPVLATDDAGAAWGYRNHLRLRVWQGRPAYVALDGRRGVPIESCPVADPRAVALAHALTGELPEGMTIDVRVGVRTGDRLILLSGSERELADLEFTTECDVSLVIDRGRGLEVAAGQPYLVEELAGRPLLVAAGSFFQANSLAAERLVAHVREFVGSGVGTLLDLFSGVGIFAVLLAESAAAIYAVELDPWAVAAAVENASGLDHVVLVAGTAAEALAELGVAAEVAVVDPPRGGLDGETLRLLTETVQTRIVYVSCDPVTLGRDARRLAAAGWLLAECRPLDMFPQTCHIETVSLFTRNG